MVIPRSLTNGSFVPFPRSDSNGPLLQAVIPGAESPANGAFPRMQKSIFGNRHRIVINVTIDVVALLFGLAALISLLK
jgi:hypothetical protein